MEHSKTLHDTTHHRDRIRLYLLVMLSIDGLAHVSDWVTPLLFKTLEIPPLPMHVWGARWALTAIVTSSWVVLRWLRPPGIALMLIEGLVTLILVLGYTYIGMYHSTGTEVQFGAIFALFGVWLLLVVRSSLVPSSVLRTLVLGVIACGSYFFVAWPSLSSLPPSVIDGLTFMSLSFILAISVTSRVIYGLQAQVRDALQLGQYRLEEKLGEGGMGQVYLAQHSRLRRPTAVKLLPNEQSSEESIARFEAEVQATAELTHPNTVRIFDYGRTDEGIFYYAMEYLRGATLRELVELDGPQPVGRALKILHEAASALQEAHEAGLIHRDIKPANIMLTRQGIDVDAVKVLDFGLVRRSEDAADVARTKTQVVVGTPLYMAPELISSAGAASPRSDIYALGAVGYYLVTGTHVFSGANLVETCAHHLHTPPERLSSRLGREVATDVEALLLRCLEKTPEARFASSGAMMDAIEGCRDFSAWSAGDAQGWWSRYGDALAAARAGDRVPLDRALTVAATRG